MFPWDFDRHLDSQHRKCKVCQWYLINDEMLEDHMELERPMVATEKMKIILGMFINLFAALQGAQSSSTTR